MLGYALVAVTIVLGIAAFIFYKCKLRYKPQSMDDEWGDLRSININDIDNMSDGSGFEMYLYRLLLELGYSNVYKTVGSRDFGADVVFTDREGFRNVVQAKRYAIDSDVGISAVQEIYASMRYYKPKKAVVIDTTRFTPSCETLAGINQVKLLDRNDLINIIDAFKARRSSKSKRHY